MFAAETNYPQIGESATFADTVFLVDMVFLAVDAMIRHLLLIVHIRNFLFIWKIRITSYLDSTAWSPNEIRPIRKTLKNRILRIHSFCRGNLIDSEPKIRLPGKRILNLSKAGNRPVSRSGIKNHLRVSLQDPSTSSGRDPCLKMGQGTVSLSHLRVQVHTEPRSHNCEDCNMERLAFHIGCFMRHGTRNPFHKEKKSEYRTQRVPNTHISQTWNVRSNGTRNRPHVSLQASSTNLGASPCLKVGQGTVPMSHYKPLRQA